jgi:hypothetical protein
MKHSNSGDSHSDNTVTLELPLFMLIVATRAALGVGVGLLLAEKLREHRRAVGAALVAVGAVTTIPAAMALIRARQTAALPDVEPATTPGL